MRTRFVPLLLAALLALLPAAGARATVFVVNQSSLTWNPSDITITVGDTVRWVWHSLSHTVTNGASLADPALGTLFDAPLTSVNPTFQYRFTTVGVVPYLCRPHASLGMTGVVRVRAVTAVGGDLPDPSATLAQNSPNPFNPSTRIAFVVPDRGAPLPVSLRIYDLGGRLVRTLRQGDLPPGGYTATWDGRDENGLAAASGVYVYRLRAGPVTVSREMTLVR